MPPKQGYKLPIDYSKQTFFTRTGPNNTLTIYVPETPRVGKLMEKSLPHEKGIQLPDLSQFDVDSWSDDELVQPTSGSVPNLTQSQNKSEFLSEADTPLDQTQEDSFASPIQPAKRAPSNYCSSPIIKKNKPSEDSCMASPCLASPCLISDDEISLVEIPKRVDTSARPIKTFRKKKIAIICSSDEEDAELINTLQLSSSPVSSDKPIVIDEPSFEVDFERAAYQDKVTYFNLASAHELQILTGLTSDQSDFVLGLRPFTSEDDLELRLFSKNKGKNILKKFDSLTQSFTAIDNLIKDCKRTLSEHQIEQKQLISSQPQFLSKNISLKPYQVSGINWLLNKFHNKCGVILADEMGLGKTCQVITMIGKLVEDNVAGPHLVVVPSSVLDNWLAEFKKFCPSIDVMAYRGSQSERLDIYNLYRKKKLPHFDVIVTTYNLFNSNKYDRDFMKRIDFQSLILDEAHQVKNPNSQSCRSLIKLNAPFRLLLTGTPLQNNLMELLTLLTFINPKLFISGKKDQDLDMIFSANPADSKDKHLLSKHALELLRVRIERVKSVMLPFILRRCKEQVLKDLPTKTESIEVCPLTPVQRASYSAALRSARNSTEHGHSMLLALSSRLRRIANHTLLIPRGHFYSHEIRRKIADRIVHDPKFYDSDKDVIFQELLEYADSDILELCEKYLAVNRYVLKNNEWMESGKVEWIKAKFPSMIKNGDRILVFSQFTMMLDILEKVMATLEIPFFRIDGTTDVSERQDIIDDFNQNDSVKVFLLSTRSGGCGINLTGANVVVIHDIDHNPQNDRQAEARSHRVGQTRDVRVYKLISEATIEERILSIGNAKLELDSKLSGDSRSLEGIGSEQSAEGEAALLQFLRDEIQKEEN